MIGRIGQRQDHRALVDSRIASTTFRVNAPPMVLTPMIVVGLMLFDRRDEILGRRMRMRVGPLEIDEVGAAGLRADR